MSGYDLHEQAASIIRDAGGELVGRTRLQKVAYLGKLAGFETKFNFEYRHYGPFSEELANAIQIASGLKMVQEEERPTGRGGWYSIFRAANSQPKDASQRTQFISTAAQLGAIELELAATAAYLYEVEGFGKNGKGDPWIETTNRKPEKAAGGRIEQAKAAYRVLRALPTPVSLPAIA